VLHYVPRPDEHKLVGKSRAIPATVQAYKAMLDETTDTVDCGTPTTANRLRDFIVTRNDGAALLAESAR
jgi:hypothetical protein